MKQGKGSLSSPRGMYAYKSNPMPQPSRVSSQCGPGSNPAQSKVNTLLKQQHAQKESLRGQSGM